MGRAHRASGARPGSPAAADCADALPIGGRGTTVVRLEGVVVILDLYRQGLTVSEIARESGLDRKTVRRYIEHQWDAVA